ncbi:MAG: adenosylmethionine--8-amino-7-oxononanoate transaminase [Bacteroidetes bacterium MedPE-SWsnd-G2]|nr:MAG: adenosylmethionine--8-amino-7-oxononanoate transaminase [Bacteroidetes bacterium MedPE-SWsnd-G2]
MSLQERDKKHIWHPLTQHQLHPEQLAIAKAEGCILTDETGKTYIDGISSWYTCMYGHCNPHIIDAVHAQMKQLDQVVFSGFTHQPAVELSEALIDILPKNQNKLFFSDNGSTTVEIGIKMALQYHFNKGEKRNVMLAFEGGFHGDTFGAMSVSGLSVYNGPFEDFFIDVKRIPTPQSENVDDIIKLIQSINTDSNIAGFVYEPLVQGAAAMQMNNSKGLNNILDYCQSQNILTIADEVMTGFGKTGTYFASQQIDTLPDIICLSKSLTAGMVPMGITACTQKVYDAFLSHDISKGLFHGHTYSANPLACAAALAGIKQLTSQGIQDNIKRIINAHTIFDQHISKHPKVKSTRQTGVIFALDLNIEMSRYGDLRDKLFNYFMAHGVFLRPLGNTIYILAPFVISETQLQNIYDTIEGCLNHL